MNDADRQTLVTAAMDQARAAVDDPKSAWSWWWLSFVDPGPDQFLGVVILDAPTVEAAFLRSHQLGLNPGGEIRAWPLVGDPNPDFIYRVLSRAEAETGTM